MGDFSWLTGNVWMRYNVLYKFEEDCAMKRVFSLLLVALLMFSSMIAFAEATPEVTANTEEAFAQWNPDAP